MLVVGPAAVSNRYWCNFDSNMGDEQDTGGEVVVLIRHLMYGAYE